MQKYIQLHIAIMQSRNIQMSLSSTNPNNPNPNASLSHQQDKNKSIPSHSLSQIQPESVFDPMQ